MSSSKIFTADPAAWAVSSAAFLNWFSWHLIYAPHITCLKLCTRLGKKLKSDKNTVE